jgi:uncharacterized membrane protein YhaH (DUF805 family)
MTRVARFVREAFWVIALSVILAYLFFMVLGAFDPGDAAGVSIAVLVLALLWVLHAWAGRRHADDPRDPRIIEARERRGF